MNYSIFSLTIGFMIWLLATIIFRVAGQYFFLTNNRYVMIGLYLVVVPVLGLLSNWVFNKYKLNKLQAIKSAAIMVLPGMIIDTFCIQFFSFVFPNLPETDAATFGSWLMWAYSTVLVFGLMRKEKI
ncbi:DUF5367 family protein [Chryseobacterium sp. T1]